MSEEIRMRAELNRLALGEPFEPFVIVMVSGDRYRIERAEEIVVGEEVILVMSMRRRSHSILRFNQVSSVDIDPV